MQGNTPLGTRIANSMSQSMKDVFALQAIIRSAHIDKTQLNLLNSPVPE